MFQQGPVLPLDSIDKRRNNENLQSFRSENPPRHPENIPTDEFDKTRWIYSDSAEKVAKQSKYDPHRQNSHSEKQAPDGRLPSKTRQKERLAELYPTVSLENWKEISQIAADNSGVQPWSSAGEDSGGDPLWPADDGRATDKCIDKNCINPLNSASAKTSHSAKSEYEASEVLPLPSSPDGLQVDPPENETRSEYRNNIAKSSSGERKRLKVILNLLKHFNIISENLSKKILFFSQ